MKFVYMRVEFRCEEKSVETWIGGEIDSGAERDELTAMKMNKSDEMR